VAGDETEILTALRESLLDAHLTPMLHTIHAQARVGTRTLLGSVSSGIAHGILRAASALPAGSATRWTGTAGARRGPVRRPPGPA
jgi:hypothetical protein